MKSASNELKNHLESEVTSLAICWKLTLTNGTVYGFTDCNKDLTIDSQLYKASTGFSPTTIETSNQFNVDNLDIAGILNDASITEADIMAGLYDYAKVQIFMVNINDLSQGIIKHRTGWIGEIKVQDNHFTAEIRGLAQKLTQSVGELFTPTCRAILGDTRCGLDLTPFTVSGTVDTNSNTQTFLSEDLTQTAGYFSGGEIFWTAGANINRRMEVKEFANKQVTLMLPMANPIVPSDTFEITAGCDKTLPTCKTVFDNVVNFRGEPHVPGMNRLLSNPLTASELESV